MKVTIEKPDKEIELSHGDIVRIYVRNKTIKFWFFCDGSGNSFELSKEELSEMLK